MKVLSEKPSDDTIMEFEMSEDERKTLIAYGKEHIDEDSLIQFAITDMLKRGIEYVQLEADAELVNDVCANAAELGCPRDKEVDMWYRELSPDGRIEVIKSVKNIHKTMGLTDDND